MTSGPPPFRGRGVVGRGRAPFVVPEIPRRPGRTIDVPVHNVSSDVSMRLVESDKSDVSMEVLGASGSSEEMLFFRGSRNEKPDRVPISFGHVDESTIGVDEANYFRSSGSNQGPKIPVPQLRRPRNQDPLRQNYVPQTKEPSTISDERRMASVQPKIPGLQQPSVFRRPLPVQEQKSTWDHEDSDDLNMVPYQDFDIDGNLISNKHGLLPGQTPNYRMFSKPLGRLFRKRPDNLEGSTSSSEDPTSWIPVERALSASDHRSIEKIMSTFYKMKTVPDDDFPNHRAVKIEEATKRAFHSVPASPPRGASTVVLDGELDLEKLSLEDSIAVINKLQREAERSYLEVTTFRTGNEGLPNRYQALSNSSQENLVMQIAKLKLDESFTAPASYEQQPSFYQQVPQIPQQVQQPAMSSSLSRVQSEMNILGSPGYPPQPAVGQVGYAPAYYDYYAMQQANVQSYLMAQAEASRTSDMQSQEIPEEEVTYLAGDKGRGRKRSSHAVSSKLLPLAGSFPRRPGQHLLQQPARPQHPPTGIETSHSIMSDSGLFQSQAGEQHVQPTSNSLVSPRPSTQPSMKPSGLAPVCSLVQPSMEPLGPSTIQPSGLTYLHPPVQTNMQAIMHQDMDSPLPSMLPHSDAYFSGHQSFFNYMAGQTEDLTEVQPAVPLDNSCDEVPIEAPVELQPEAAAPTWSVLSPTAKEFYPKGYVPPNEIPDPEAEMNYRLEHLTNQLLHTEIEDSYPDNSYLPFDPTANYESPQDVETTLFDEHEMWDMITLCQHELVTNPGNFDALMLELKPSFKKWLKDYNCTQNLVDFIFDVTIHIHPFIYLSAKMCVYITDLTKSLFQKKMIQKCQTFFKNMKQLLAQNQPHMICGYVLFLAELYVQSKNKKGERLNEFSMPLLGCLELLLKHPDEPKHLEAFVKALKLAGIYMDEDMNPETSKLIKNAGRVAGGLGDTAEVAALIAVIKARENNWGRSLEASKEENAKEEEIQANHGDLQSSQLDEVYYSPDGQVMTAEERFFLETQGAPSSADQDGKNDDGNDSMDEEMQEAFEQFLLMVPDAR